MPTFVERDIILTYKTKNIPFHTYESSDARAIRKAINDLEKDLGLMKNGLIKRFKDNPDDIMVILR